LQKFQITYYLYIITWSHPHTGKSAHCHIGTWADRHIVTSAHRHII
jgi:hypothetical protein